MRSFTALLVVVLVGSGVEIGRVRSAVLRVPTPTITSGPRIEDIEALVKRQDPDAVSLAQVLLTAMPESLRQIAATNVPAVSSILWEEFLDDNKPQWFLDLPQDIQNYLIRQFGPQTAWPTEPAATLSSGAEASVTATATDPEQTSETASQPTDSGTFQTTQSSAVGDSTTSAASVTATSAGSTDISASASTNPSTLSRSLSSAYHSSTPSSTAALDSPPDSSSSLSRNQKIGIGVGVPFAILGAAALGLGCCLLLRRRQRKKVDGSLPPSSPGFIPRFAFQEKSAENLEHRMPLNRDLNRSTHDLSNTAWDDDVIEPMETPHRPGPTPLPGAAMAMNNQKPVMAPALFHTHSSNRARGKRTSYTSLHSVAEVSEPDEVESPVLGRHTSPKASPARILIPPPVPAAAQIKRKPVPSSPTAYSPAAQAASHALLRQTMPDHSGSSSSGLGLSGSSGFVSSDSSGLGSHTEVTSPVSPISDHPPKNPFSNDYSYVEDYGPEYQSGYIDVENGLYGGHTSLSRYPEPRSAGRTEWPLRNTFSKSHRRNKSPLWDRVYDG